MKTRKRAGRSKQATPTKSTERSKNKRQRKESEPSDQEEKQVALCDDCSSPDPPSALHVSTCQGALGDIKRMARIIQNDPEALTRIQDSSRHVKEKAIYPEQFSPLHDAAEQGHIRCVEFLINSGANVDQVCKNMTPLQNIIMSDFNSGSKITMVETLLKNGAGVNVTWDPKAAKTAMLRYAIKNQEYKIIEILLDYGAITEHFVNTSGECCRPFPCKYSMKTPLASAINYLDSNSVRLLLIRGASLKFYCDLTDTSEYFSVPLFILNRIAWSPVAITINNIKEAIKILKIYKEFGGKLPVVPFRVGDSNCKHANTSTNHGKFGILHLKPEVGSRVLPILVKLVEMVTTPRTLGSIARMSIINQMGRNFWANKDKLPLPKDIINYLVEYPDLDDDMSIDLCCHHRR